MKSFESFRSAEEEIEASSEKPIFEQREKMFTEEVSLLSEKFKAVSGKARALVGLFILSSALNYGYAEDLQKVQAKEMGQKNEVVSEFSLEDDHGLDVPLLNDGQYVWGVEYAQKGVGQDQFLAERYVKINLADNHKTTVGEYDDVFTAAVELKKMNDIPERLKNYSERSARAIETERAFEASGLLKKPTNVADTPVHTEEREFNGYGITVKMTVQVDENGNIFSRTMHE